jgi:hypothetical protein
MALIFYQNRDFYLSEQTLSLNLFFTKLGMPPYRHIAEPARPGGRGSQQITG